MMYGTDIEALNRLVRKTFIAGRVAPEEQYFNQTMKSNAL